VIIQNSYTGKNHGKILYFSRDFSQCTNYIIVEAALLDMGRTLFIWEAQDFWGFIKCPSIFWQVNKRVTGLILTKILSSEMQKRLFLSKSKLMGL